MTKQKTEKELIEEIKKLNKFVGAFDPETNDKKIYDKMLDNLIQKAQLQTLQNTKTQIIEEVGKMLKINENMINEGRIIGVAKRTPFIDGDKLIKIIKDLEEKGK